MTCRPTPTVAAFGLVTSGGTSTCTSLSASARQASRHPALSSSAENARAIEREAGVVRRRSDLDLAFLAGTVAAAGRVDRDAVPAGGVEHRDARRHAHPQAGREEVQLDPGRRAGEASRGHLSHGAAAVTACTAAFAECGRVRLRGCVRLRAHAGMLACGRPLAAAARCAAIQPAPHASRLVSRSAAFTARTSWADRASMIALVRPLLMAIGRNAAPIELALGHPERHVRRSERHVDAELCAQQLDRLQRAQHERGVRADRHRERVDEDVFERDAVGRRSQRRRSCAASSSRRTGSSGISSSSFGQRDHCGAVSLNERQDRVHPLVLGGDRVHERLALIGR